MNAEHHPSKVITLPVITEPFPAFLAPHSIPHIILHGTWRIRCIYRKWNCHLYSTPQWCTNLDLDVNLSNPKIRENFMHTNCLCVKFTIFFCRKKLPVLQQCSHTFVYIRTQFSISKPDLMVVLHVLCHIDRAVLHAVKLLSCREGFLQPFSFWSKV